MIREMDADGGGAVERTEFLVYMLASLGQVQREDADKILARPRSRKVALVQRPWCCAACGARPAVLGEPRRRAVPFVAVVRDT